MGAYGLIFDNRRQLNSDIKEILTDISIMEDVPQFEYTEKELKFVANVLLNSENFNKKIKRLSDILNDPQFAIHWE